MEAAAPARTLPEVVLPPLPVEGARRMWVEQFRASRYLDLLSDETVNRALLQWLKLWDGCVFHREPKLHTHLGFGKRKAANNPKTFVPRAFGGVPDYCFTLDADRRPRFKTALLCGPPGLGKTTLAHVIARHAGYDTLEINASDDRALDVFRNRVESSLMHGNIAALMQDGVAVDRPKCLIIDEVDGAPAATVDYLVHLLKGEAKSASGKKKAQRKLALWRPIICICNDQYVPALKPLRQVSVVVQFPPIHRERLAQRMLDICRSLPIQADSSVIHVLCEKSEDDIRTCLNTIQFASVQGNRLAVADISQTTIGRKDSRKQLFGIWDTVFRAPGAGRQNEISEGASEKDSTRSVLRTVQQEDLEKILSGLYENYLRVKHKESRLISAAQCANWFCFADILERGVMEEQSWFLRGYASFSPVALHVLLSGNAVPKLNFPQQQVEFRSRCGRNKEIMDAFVKDLPAGLYRVVKSGALSSEFVPYLVNILQPILKGHNIQLLNPSERVLVRDVVAQMVAYGVSYREESSPSGTVDLLLDPHLEAVAHFPGTSPTSAAGTLTLAAKEMIAAQVRLRLVEVEASHAAPPETPTPGVMETPEVLLGLGSVPEKEAGHRGVSSRKLRVWSVQEYLRQQVPMDPDAPVVVAGGTKRRVWYKYKEGCTNAVCRDVQVQRFL
ncbi:chromosome transmission fidelity protein 18 homolog [Paramacrobiotus metropolitanus]|uniref:chromosome transmission fidelity protein 18 homolog n=1 Tax=Paramacrobiotus metropolitanus TaxID=2943436 RepID=UPI0024462787|nr:chromosome transmission fidelity protein 18 homolog [Paramacrobiotus metropolitanus]